MTGGPRGFPPREAPSDDARPPAAAILGLAGATLLVGVSLIGMTSSLPAIVADLSGTQSDYAAVITGSLLASAIGIPIWGRLADRFDRKRLLQAALLLLLLASIAAALAPSTVALVVARSAQGLATGGIVALTSIVVGTIVPLARRSGYLGLLGAVSSLSLAAAPVACGLITDALGWRWAFGLSAVLATAMLIVLQIVLRVPFVHRQAGRFDYGGLGLLAVGLGSVLVGVGLVGNGAPPTDAAPLVLFALGVLAIGGLIAVESKVAAPIISPQLLRVRTIGLAAALNLTSSVAVYGVAIFVAQYLQIALGLPVAEASLYLIPQVAGTVLSSLAVGALVQRRGSYKWWVVAGCAIAASSLVALTAVRHEVPAGLVSVIVFALGLGLGAVSQNLVLAAQGSVGQDRLGAATSAVGFFGSVGGLLGASTLASVLQLRLLALGEAAETEGLADVLRTVPDIAALEAGMRVAVQAVYAAALADLFGIVAPFLMIATAIAVLLPNRRVR